MATTATRGNKSEPSRDYINPKGRTVCLLQMDAHIILLQGWRRRLMERWPYSSPVPTLIFPCASSPCPLCLLGMLVSILHMTLIFLSNSLLSPPWKVSLKFRKSKYAKRQYSKETSWRTNVQFLFSSSPPPFSKKLTVSNETCFYKTATYVATRQTSFSDPVWQMSLKQN